MKFFAFFTLLMGVAAAGDLLPLEMGNYWTYREERTGESFTIRVGQPVWMQSGKTYHYVSGYAGDRVLARVDDNGNLMMLDEESGSEKLLTGFAERGGTWWAAPARECRQEGQALEKRVSYDGPGGRWARVLAVKYQTLGCADAGVLSEQYAENIGLLQREVSTLAGPRTFDLVHARVGSQIIETVDRGRFSVAVEQPLGQDFWRVTLRVDLGYVPSVRLRFPSAQEFDLVLRDASGQIVWRWSDGRFFDQGVHEKEIGNVWSQTVTVQKPAGVGLEELMRYTLEGWLTSAPDGPRFAATAPVPAPRIQPAAAARRSPR